MAATQRCLWCESERLEDGKLEGTGRIYFKPQNARFFVMTTSEVDLRARVCVDCGYIDLYADTAKLKKLLK
jgi:predicted nucleic-acid-binding Zn-ribbon protein